MKRNLIILLLLMMSLSVFAQGHKPHNHESKVPCKDVQEIVSNLSTSQKKKIDAITKQMQSTCDALKKQELQVKDSIKHYLQQEGDQSTTLYPLFEREAAIKCSISKEMYGAKIKIEKILTTTQKEELKKALDKKKKEKHCNK